MSATISRKYMMARSTDAFRSFFHLGVLIAALIFAVGVVDVSANNGPANPPETPKSGLADAVQAVAVAAAVVTEPPAEATESDEPDEEILTPRMRAVLAHITHRYKVSAEALGPIFEAAQLIGREQRIDPLLIVAIIGIESGFNPFAESPLGAQGLMQVIPRFHKDKVPLGAGKRPLFDPVTNIQVGARVLEEAIRRRGGLIAGLQQFGGAADDEEQSYAAKVLAEKQRLEQVARRIGGASA
jgi:hypothetical protein